ncbi:TraR/DksA family transcriptional regulator [Mycetocola reblochoni]|uniref:DnaK suppressor protein n=2 Tax=Mycetocola reblochoni TaxID=331618 RepID=A0A1R4IL91_9MICO|nr:TraR/DksA C4-type zinc finger protein [Mycetocola reblochoni]RLP70144.1 molecular chaperone DnaK [Mycetocola reblochoni]SJN20425.1 DnaK suppressor protein [Mycetocola reblochoni REB411]
MTGDSREQRLVERRTSARDRLARLERQLDALRGARGAESDDDEHDPEGAPLSAEWSRLEGLRASAVDELRAIDDAVERVATGAGALCRVCGRPIPAARLEVRPEATMCVDCASRAAHG